MENISPRSIGGEDGAGFLQGMKWELSVLCEG